MKKVFIISISSIAMMLTSCLKDKNIEDQKYGMAGVEDRPVVLFPEAKATTTLEASNKDTTFQLVVVRLAEPNPASEDVKVTLVANNDLVESEGFEVAPASAYSLDNLVVTIPAGKREGYLSITTKTSNLSSATYAFGFTISAVSNPKYTISGNYKDFLAVLPVKNKYDGIWRVEGSLVDIISPTLTGHYPLEWDLVTNSGNSVTVYDRDYTGTPTHIISTGTGLSQYGSFGLVVTFDPDTDKITEVTNHYGQLSGSFVRSAFLDPTGANKYEVINGTPTIKIKYKMTQGASYTLRTTFDETWTYVGPR